MIFRTLVSIFLTAFFLSGCAPFQGAKTNGMSKRGKAGNDIGEVSFNLPATFSGQLSCTDCLEVDTVLTLRPDGLYQLRKNHQTKQGIRNSESRMNGWWYLPEEKVVILSSDDGPIHSLKVKSSEHIELLGPDYVHPEFFLKGELKQSTTLERFDDRVDARGMFSLANGEAVIEECSTGKAFPVSTYGIYSEAVSRYAAIPHSYGTPVLLEFEGILGRVDYTDAPSEEAFTITDVKEFYPDSDCVGNVLRVALTETLWTLQQINGRSVEEYTARMRPFLLLEPDLSMRGFGGCRDFAGTFQVHEDMLQIKRTPLPRYACFKGLELENAFLEAVADATSFEIEAETLKLIDSDDRVRAVFQAGPK